MQIENYVGETLEMIYIDRFARITHRKVIVWSVNPHSICAYCFHRKAPRRFVRTNILALRRKGMGA